MRIFDVENFPNPLRVRIALAEKSALDKVEFVHVDLLKGEHREPEMLAKNPLGTVPILELEDGTYISECSAITELVDQKFDGPSLTGKTPENRAVIDMMHRRAELMILEPLGDYFHQATAGLGPELEKNQVKEWGLRQKAKAEKGLKYFDESLKGNDFVAGDEFSMADITLIACMLTADFVQLDIPAEYENLQGWYARMKQKESVIKNIG